MNAPTGSVFCARQSQAKVHMPKHADNTPLDDDDILDLTEVVETGNTPLSNAPASIGADFGADLDALLDSLSADGTAPPQAVAPAAPAKPVVPTKPVAAPIADQTPAGHVVDPNEEIVMPGNADIDSLLAELGVDSSKFSAPPPKATAAAPAAPAKSGNAQADLDALLAELDLAQANAPTPAAKNTPLTDDLPDDLAAMIAAAPAAPIRPEMAETATTVAPDPAVVAAAQAALADAEAVDSIDLNELDALIDDMLATAPPAGGPQPAPAAQAESAAQAAPEAEVPAPQPESAKTAELAAPAGVDPQLVAGLTARLAGLEDEVAALRISSVAPVTMQDDELVNRLSALENDLAAMQAAQVPQTAPSAVSNDDLAARLAGLEDEVAVLRTSFAAAPPAEELEASVTAAVEARIADLLAPGSPLMERVAAGVAGALLARLSASLGDAAGAADAEDDPAVLAAAAAFRRDLDKMAASAAARVIREEIAALLQN